MNKRKYASLLQRFLALFLDGIVLCSLFFPITKIVKGVWLMSATDHNWNFGSIIFDPICLIFLIAIFIYFVVFESFLSATPGKFFLKLRVIDISGNKPGLVKGLLRNLLRFIDGLPTLNLLGIYLILTTPENMRFGDKVAKTRVIKKD